jgi:hypothetical protein
VQDTTAPTVTAATDNVGAAVTNGPISFSVTFSEAVTGVSLGSFTATNGTVSSVTQGADTSHYTVVVSPTVGVASGSVALSLVNGGATDTAGNAAVAANLSGLDSQGIDTLRPVAPTGLHLATADDTGSSSTDNITKLTSGLTIGGAGENGATATLFDDADNNGVKDAGEVVPGTATVSGGTFSTDIALATDGTHHVRAFETDVAGNASTSSAALDITIDTTGPVVQFTSESANGGSGKVNLAGTADANSVVSMYDGGSLLGTATAASNGSWSFTTAKLSDMTHSFSASSPADAAGNLGSTANTAIYGGSQNETLNGGTGNDLDDRFHEICDRELAELVERTGC